MKFVLFAMFLACFAFHSGGTDSSGGHRGPGGYHYHNGGFSSRSYARRYSPPARTEPRYEPPTRSYDFEINIDVRTQPRTKARTEPPKRIVPPEPTSKWPYVFIDFKFHGFDEGGDCKVILFVDVLVDRTTLVNVARQFKYDEVLFYLPGMKHDAKPWAVAKKINDDYRCVM